MSAFFSSESDRVAQFPVARNQIFLGHAGVTVLPACAAEAMKTYIDASSTNHQEFGEVLEDIADTRQICARLIGADAREIALLGPTSLGLSLFANGIDWKPGDELLCYQDDYPSNVYPWMSLERRGVKVRFLRPSEPGRIPPELVESSLTEKTRMVALASCHFLTGWKIDVDTIGRMLHSRGILFAIDGIQTLGAMPTSVEHVDFLSADAHKWMLGPLAIGIVYVARKHFETCYPTLLGAWNVNSPDFVTQDSIVLPDTARRYEPGVLNVAGMYGMRASLSLLLGFGIEQVSTKILHVRNHLLEGLMDLGFHTASPHAGDESSTGILTVMHPSRSSEEMSEDLRLKNITASLRHDRQKKAYLRFSPHFYNTIEEMDAVLACLRK